MVKHSVSCLMCYLKPHIAIHTKGFLNQVAGFVLVNLWSHVRIKIIYPLFPLQILYPNPIKHKITLPLVIKISASCPVFSSNPKCHCQKKNKFHIHPKLFQTLSAPWTNTVHFTSCTFFWKIIHLSYFKHTGNRICLKKYKIWQNVERVINYHF